jgi:hypothetical protein
MAQHTPPVSGIQRRASHNPASPGHAAHDNKPAHKKSNPAGLLFSIGDGTATRLGRYRHGLSQPGISCW